VLQWYGCVVDGVGFHYLEMDDALLAASVAEQENAATVIINDIDPRSKLSEQLLSDDLKKLVDANWGWQVRRASDSDFSVVFPNSASLNLCKNTGGLTLPISKVSILFVEPRLDPAASMSLSKVWVLMSDVPGVLRRSDLLLESTNMIGGPRIVDEGTLAGKDPIRMLFHSPNPYAILKSVRLFANLQGFRLGLTVEVPKGKEATSHPSSDQDRAEEDDKTEDVSRSETHWKCQPNKSAPQANPPADKGNPSQADDLPNKKQAPLPVAPSSPQPAPQKEYLYTYKKGYYKVSAGRLRSKQSVDSSSVPPPPPLRSILRCPSLLLLRCCLRLSRSRSINMALTSLVPLPLVIPLLVPNLLVGAQRPFSCLKTTPLRRHWMCSKSKR
jgi:hypothetical protein